MVEPIVAPPASVTLLPLTAPLTVSAPAVDSRRILPAVSSPGRAAVETSPAVVNPSAATIRTSPAPVPFAFAPETVRAFLSLTRIDPADVVASKEPKSLFAFARMMSPSAVTVARPVTSSVLPATCVTPPADVMVSVSVAVTSSRASPSAESSLTDTALPVAFSEPSALPSFPSVMFLPSAVTVARPVTSSVLPALCVTSPAAVTVSDAALVAPRFRSPSESTIMTSPAAPVLPTASTEPNLFPASERVTTLPSATVTAVAPVTSAAALCVTSPAAVTVSDAALVAPSFRSPSESTIATSPAAPVLPTAPTEPNLFPALSSVTALPSATVTAVAPVTSTAALCVTSPAAVTISDAALVAPNDTAPPTASISAAAAASTLPPRTMPCRTSSVEAPFATSSTFPSVASIVVPPTVWIDPLESILTFLALIVPPRTFTPAGEFSTYAPPGKVCVNVSLPVVEIVMSPFEAVTFLLTTTYSSALTVTLPPVAVTVPLSTCTDIAAASPSPSTVPSVTFLPETLPLWILTLMPEDASVTSSVTSPASAVTFAATLMLPPALTVTPPLPDRAPEITAASAPLFPAVTATLPASATAVAPFRTATTPAESIFTSPPVAFVMPDIRRMPLSA